MQLIAIAAGGALGALFRYWVSNGVHLVVGRSFPYGTLTVNVIGSLCIGLLYVFFNERFEVAAPWRALMMVGVLGAFTTFSTFSVETLNLIESGQFVRAMLNMLLSVVLCVAAAGLGVLLARQI